MLCIGNMDILMKCSVLDNLKMKLYNKYINIVNLGYTYVCIRKIA